METGKFDSCFEVLNFMFFGFQKHLAAINMYKITSICWMKLWKKTLQEMVISYFVYFLCLFLLFIFLAELELVQSKEVTQERSGEIGKQF